ncbi:MAG: hypothetical protein E7321_03530 [Clostridiales bacterium]|nr:hypothetical protein [Clostridiales bacterium]
MYKMMKVLAIVVLIVTIAGAGAVLYGINTLSPVVEQVSMAVTPAAQAQDIFDSALAQVSRGTFTGRVFAQPGTLNAQDCAFVTCTVRLANKGFFPAEWVSLDVQPVQGDVLQLDNVQANVLASGSRGDIAATILHTGDGAQTPRTYTINCYVFGRKITLEGTAQ